MKKNFATAILMIMTCFMTLETIAQNATPKDGPGCLSLDNRFYQTTTTDGGANWSSGDYFIYDQTSCMYSAGSPGRSCLINMVGGGRKSGYVVTLKLTPENCPLDNSAAIVPVAFVLIGFSVYRLRKGNNTKN